MYSRVNYTIVGIFVLLFGAGLVAFTFWLAKYGMQSNDKVYKLYMTESVSGLSKDSTVRLHGVNVGRVSDIRIDPNDVKRIEIRVKIRSDVPIKKDMTAHTEMLGITGLLAIEISGGSNASPPLVGKNGKIPVIPTVPSWFSKTTKGIGNMAENLNTVLQKAEKLLNDKNIETFASILENTDAITAKAVGTLDAFNTTMAVYREAARKLGSDVDSLTQNFNRISKETVPAITALHKATKDFNRLTLSAQKSLNRGDFNIKETFEPMLIDIGILTEQMTDLTRELRNDPSSILFRSRKRRKGPGE